MTDHAAKRPFPLMPESTNHPWLGLKAPDKMRDGSSPNSTVGMQSNFADGGIIGNGLTGDQVTALPSPGSAPQPQLLADGGKVEENDDENPQIDPEDLGSGTLADAASDLTGRELQVENQIRAAQGLPPLKAKK